MGNSLFEIYWMEGRSLITRIVDHVPGDDSLTSAVREGAVDLAPEMDVCYDPSLGLWVEFRYHAPSENFDAAESKKRGVPTDNKTAFYYWVIEAGELCNVASVNYLGKPLLARIDGALVPMNKVDSLSSVYLGDASDGSVIDRIGRVAEAMERELAVAGIVGDEASLRIADAMGMDGETIAKARAFAESAAMQDADGEEDFADEDWDGDGGYYG